MNQIKNQQTFEELKKRDIEVNTKIDDNKNSFFLLTVVLGMGSPIISMDEFDENSLKIIFIEIEKYKNSKQKGGKKKNFSYKEKYFKYKKKYETIKNIITKFNY